MSFSVQTLVKSPKNMNMKMSFAIKLADPNTIPSTNDNRP
ncbi:hypothetical protein BVRB_1g020000 [Beta vulgaris subsp. vulgaris]|nr:hypothetical protein BVRB_1g020000 [Beta vulgaris subsp. vulgaris]